MAKGDFMATVAVYVFDSIDEAQHAMDKIYNNIGSGGCFRNGNEVHIESSCSDPSQASKICRACGGSSR